MSLLTSVGIEVSEYHLIASGEETTTPPFPGPYVVKLADVAHRTEHKAVRVNVPTEESPWLFPISADHCGTRRAIPRWPYSPWSKRHGEAFVGVQGHSELGPFSLEAHS